MQAEAFGMDLQSPDVNIIEKLCVDLNRAVHIR